jgi:hypothetical protein
MKNDFISVVWFIIGYLVLRYILYTIFIKYIHKTKPARLVWNTDDSDMLQILINKWSYYAKGLKTAWALAFRMFSVYLVAQELR